ncbi:MAG: outer membrane protein assembly factor BamE, partial [Rhodoferax sp.]
DELPTEAEFVASLDSGRQSGKVPVLEMAEPASLPQSAPVPEATPLPPVPATYPPLEPAGR